MSLLNWAPCAPLRLRALPFNNARFSRMRADTDYPSLIRNLRACEPYLSLIRALRPCAPYLS